MELLGGKIPSGVSVTVDVNAGNSALEFKTKEGKGKKEEDKSKK
jgi:hypothetical protein